MKTRWICLVGSAAIVCGLGFRECHLPQVQADEIVEPSAETEATNPDADITSFMHDKLVYSQSVLHGLVIQDFTQVERGAERLRATSLVSPGPYSRDALDDELYEHFRLEFLRLSTDLGKMARDENLAGAAFTYNNLTANCMACHQYLQDRTAQRVTGLEQDTPE